MPHLGEQFIKRGFIVKVSLIYYTIKHVLKHLKFTLRNIWQRILNKYNILGENEPIHLFCIGCIPAVLFSDAPLLQSSLPVIIDSDALPVLTSCPVTKTCKVSKIDICFSLFEAKCDQFQNQAYECQSFTFGYQATNLSFLNLATLLHVMPGQCVQTQQYPENYLPIFSKTISKINWRKILKSYNNPLFYHLDLFLHLGQ